MHATAEEARAETQQMLNIYADFLENVLAMPVVKGQKTDKEKFNGAEETYTVECMMHDHKALRPALATTSATASPGPLTSPSPARTTPSTIPTRPPGGLHPDDRGASS